MFILHPLPLLPMLHHRHREATNLIVALLVLSSIAAAGDEPIAALLAWVTERGGEVLK